MNDFRKLKAWQIAREVAVSAYRLTAPFPPVERFGLAVQIRRSASSVPANIAEGCGRFTSADQTRFLQIAFGSACELESHLSLAHELRLIAPDSYEQLQQTIERMKRLLAGLIRRKRENKD